MRCSAGSFRRRVRSSWLVCARWQSYSTRIHFWASDVRHLLITHDSIGDDLRCVQDSVDHLGQLLAHTEESVVEFRVSSWIDPAEVIHSLELSDRVSDQCSKLQHAAVL